MLNTNLVMFFGTALTLLMLSDGVSGSIQCTSCTGNGVGSSCELNPEKEPGRLTCASRCTNYARLLKYDGGKMFQLVRGCAAGTFPVPIPRQFENTCKDDNAHFIECTHSCNNADFCNSKISHAPPGWNKYGVYSGVPILNSCSILIFGVLATKLTL